jgi:two-component system sensor histidine kinase DegS
LTSSPSALTIAIGEICMSADGDRTPRPSQPRVVDAQAVLEQELDPERGLRSLFTGALAFRVGSLVWMITLNLVSGGFSRPWLAYASFAAATVWTAWLFLHPKDQSRQWALWFDLALTTLLIVVSAYVVPHQAVISPHRLFFATAYPVSTPIMWGMSKRVWGGLGSAAVMSVALFLTRPLNHVPITHVSDVIGVANGSAYFLIAGYTLGVITGALDRSAESIRRTIGVAIEEQDHARWADTARELHDSVLNGLGILKRKLEELQAEVARRSNERERSGVQSELKWLTGYTSDQERGLRDWINRDRRAAAGMANLGDRLRETRAKVLRIDVQVNSVGRIMVPEQIATEVCAIVKEALQNVEEHAETDRAFVFAEVDDGWLLISIRDHGKGYNPSEHPPSSHIGRVGMRQRAKGLGGGLWETSAPGAGTTVELRIAAHPDWGTQ